MANFTPAPEVRRIGEDLIERKTRLADLLRLRPRIEYVFVDKAPVKDGNTVYALAKKVSGLAAYLADRQSEDDKLLEISRVARERADRIKMPYAEKEKLRRIIDPVWGDSLFVIQVSLDTWTCITDARMKEALVFHELCHLYVEEKEDEETGREYLALSLRGHDFEEMLDVVKEYGAWTKALKEAMATAVEYSVQKSLDFEKPERGGLSGTENELIAGIAESMRQIEELQNVRLEVVGE